MKFNKSKWIAPFAALLLMTGASSCVGDLDVTPINPQQTLVLDPDALFNKIYASFSLTGQTGPDGNKDIDMDEGRSDFYRMIWYMNEFTTDEAHWVWATDAGVPDLLHNSYGSANIFSTGLYYRLYFTITLCNFYLEQIADDGTEETARRRAEVRFIRALNYYYVMDMYGAAAFTEKVSSELAERYTREQYFEYIETELTEIENDLANAGQNTYGRIDKVALWNLLSRLYLNAEVYTGTARWKDAKDYAEKVLNNGYYHLMKTGATNPVTGEEYSAYQMLFLADNNTNGAQYEAIFPVLNDGEITKAHGGMNFLVLSTYASAKDGKGMDAYVPSGTDCSWGKCTRVRRQLLDKFYTSTSAPNSHVVKEMTAAAKDNRALFYGEDYSADIVDESDAAAGFGCVKFRNVRSDGAPTKTIDKVDTDLPLMRIAEAYLTYAEASTRLNGATEDAAKKINDLRDRAGATHQNLYTLDDICDEWAREFWFEGRRRMDLVRFGKFGGQGSYTWEWMGGTYEGRQFSANMNIFSIPDNDLTNNPNLLPTPGY